MGKSKKKDKSEKINFLRQQYEAFLEDDRKRRERNEYILKRLDNMRTCAASPHSKDPATMKINTTGVFSDASKMPVQTRPPLIRSTLLQNNTSTILVPQFSENQMAISKNTTENNIEQTILKEISKKYILIPKLPSQYYIESEINEPTPQPKHDPIDNEWKAKYDILEKLNSIGDDNDKNFNETNNNIEDTKLNKNISLFGDKRKEDQDRIYINSKISQVNGSRTVRMSKEQYNSDNPVSLESTNKESYSNNTKELFDNNINMNNQRDGDVIIVKNNALNSKIENFDYKPEEISVSDEKYDKDIDNEKGKINTFNVYDQPLNPKTITDSTDTETSQLFRGLKHHDDSIQYLSSNPSQRPDISQNKHQLKLETNAISTPQFENDQYNEEDHTSQAYTLEQNSQKNQQFREIPLTALGNQADKNSQPVIQANEHITFPQNEHPPSQVPHQLQEKENKQMIQPTSETTLKELSTTLHQNNIYDQGWNEDQPIYQPPVENYQQVYNQEATEPYENKSAHPEQTYEQYDYSGIESEQNKSDPNKSYETTQYAQDNQSVAMQQPSSAAPNQHQQNSEEQGKYPQNEEGPYEAQYHQSDIPAQYQQDIGQDQYLSNDQQGHYQENKETVQYLQSAAHGQHQKPDTPKQDTGQEQYLSNDQQGHYQEDNVSGQYLQSAEHGQYQQAYSQDTGQEQYLSNDPQGHYQQDNANVPGQYLQSAEHGQYQQPDRPKQDIGHEQYLSNDQQEHNEQNNVAEQYLQSTEHGQYQQLNRPTEGQYLPDNGGPQYEGQYQNSDEPGQYQQENVQGEYLANVVQYPQAEGLEQYPQNYEQGQYLPNDGQSQFEGQYQYETDPNYTQQQYAEYSERELASADVQHAQMERDQQPARDDIQQSVDNITEQ